MDDKMTEDRLIKMIQRLIAAQGWCVISNEMLTEVFNVRSRYSSGISRAERVLEFCSRYNLEIGSALFPDKTVFKPSKHTP